MLNRCTLIGRLTKDVELRSVENIPLANFTLAVNKRYKSKNEDAPTADFIPVTVWRKGAEFASAYFSKGKQVYVSGRLETYSYEKDGEIRYGFRVNADEIGFADSVKTDHNGEENHSRQDDIETYMPVTEDDLPF